jgi:hypothetical protein
MCMEESSKCLALLFCSLLLSPTLSLPSFSSFTPLHSLFSYVPSSKRYIVRILLMVPIYSMYSIASIYWEGARLYFAVLRDAYESYVLYCFFVLCMNYAGGVDILGRKLLEQPVLRLPPPLHCYTVQPNK